MQITNAEQLISLDEGREALPYQDQKGIWTIGIGHNLEANDLPANIAASIYARMGNASASSGPVFFPQCKSLIESADGLTDNEINDLFQIDLTANCGFLNTYSWFVSTDEVRQAALMDMAFNLGPYGFHKFTTFLEYCAEHDWQQAAEDLRMNTLVYKQLPVRYGRLVQMLESGAWPQV